MMENKENSLFSFENENKLIQEELIKDQIYFAKRLEEDGKFFLKEIEKKRKKNLSKKDQMILYIVKHSKNKYDVDDLIDYDYRDIVDIFNDIKYQNRSWWIKFFEMFFSLIVMSTVPVLVF